MSCTRGLLSGQVLQLLQAFEGSCESLITLLHTLPTRLLLAFEGSARLWGHYLTDVAQSIHGQCDDHATNNQGNHYKSSALN